MKTNLALLCTLVALGAWAFWPKPAPAIVAVAAATPAPAPQRNVAPNGVYFTVEYVSARTRSGVIGFPPGQELRLVEAHDSKGTWLMSDGKYQAEISPNALTNDLDAAARAAANDSNEQGALAAQRSIDEFRAHKETVKILEASEAHLRSNVVSGGKFGGLDDSASHPRHGHAVSGAAVIVDQNGYAVPMHSL